MVYVCCEDIDIKSIRNEYLRLIGGQSHVQCQEHLSPLIVSFEKEKQCQNCRRKAKYCCSQLSCNVCLCSRCFGSFEKDTISYITSRTTINEEDEEDNNRNINIDSDNDSLLSEDDSENNQIDQDEMGNDGIDQDGIVKDEIYQDGDDDILRSNDLDDYLTSTIPTDGVLNESLDDLDDLDIDNFGILPTTDAGDIAIEVEEKTV